jgi:hypothetical protein
VGIARLALNGIVARNLSGMLRASVLLYLRSNTWLAALVLSLVMQERLKVLEAGGLI